LTGASIWACHRNEEQCDKGGNTILRTLPEFM